MTKEQAISLFKGAYELGAYKTVGALVGLKFLEDDVLKLTPEDKQVWKAGDLSKFCEDNGISQDMTLSEAIKKLLL